MGAQDVLRAIADPHRREILRLVRDHARSVGEIASHFELSQQAVSQHLAVLRDAGLVVSRKEGTRHLFLVRSEGFEPVEAFLREFWGAGLDRLKAAAEQRARRPKRKK